MFNGCLNSRGKTGSVGDCEARFPNVLCLSKADARMGVAMSRHIFGSSNVSEVLLETHRRNT